MCIYLTRRDSHKYFTDFDQLLHDCSEAPNNKLCKAVNCISVYFSEKIMTLGHDDRSLLNLGESIDISKTSNFRFFDVCFNGSTVSDCGMTPMFIRCRKTVCIAYFYDNYHSSLCALFCQGTL